MGGLQSGGGTSAVAASAHAGCERFRLTDPFITRETRKALAVRIGHPDVSAGIPEARWMRAMTFESLVHSERFVAELLTKAVGRLGLARPVAIRRRDCKGTVEETALALAQAHLDAESSGVATMLVALAVPYLELEGVHGATAIQPDFAIVCPQEGSDRPGRSWLVMGDAKDYERVRSRIDDGRLLKGFLQVALGAESARVWSGLPDGMDVHRFGALAVPRNAFLQPEAVVELLDDYRTEVRVHADERLKAREGIGENRPGGSDLGAYVAHIDATFDPDSCATCNLFSYCRHELRTSTDPMALLTEIGVARLERAAVVGLVTGGGEQGRAPARTLAQVSATVTGLPVPTGRRRVDPCGLPGTVNVVVAKSDAAALGVHGVAVQRVTSGGAEPWVRRTFPEPQSPLTRRALMRVLGEAIGAVLTSGEGPVHLVVPDGATADLLASTADSLAGVELSRLRWQRDLDMGREPLSFDGEPATIPDPLDPAERLAVSFLLEEDRARAMSLRSPIVDLRAVLACHVVPGGPASDAGRLDYLVRWVTATSPVDHRRVSDEIAAEPHTPGARLSNIESDAIHQAYRRRAEHPAAYTDRVRSALDYKVAVLEAALAALEGMAGSQLREVYRTLEADAQQVWGRRLALQASDLVRFSRTYRTWRNAQVAMIDADTACSSQLDCLVDRSVALEKAQDAGVRELAVATVIGVDPLRLSVRSRRLADGCTVVALHLNDQAIVENPATTVRIQKGSFKLGNMPIGPLAAQDGVDGLVWAPRCPPPTAIGDRLILADALWFGALLTSGHEIKVSRPSLDNQAAPKATCTALSYEADPEEHQWCCKPHTVAEAEWSDLLAERRENGELNPEVWPPLVDEERFDVGPQQPPASLRTTPVPDGLTLDDLD